MELARVVISMTTDASCPWAESMVVTRIASLSRRSGNRSASPLKRSLKPLAVVARLIHVPPVSPLLA
eukprot:7106272-Pyramimonas_sp.AAC.1